MNLLQKEQTCQVFAYYIKFKGMIVSRMLISNGSALNVYPIMILGCICIDNL